MVFVESYLHKLSKDVLSEWITDPLTETNTFFNIFEFKNTNRKNNILYEYCIYNNHKINSIKYDWTDLIGDGVNDYNPDFKDLIKHGIFSVAVCDMCILRNNKPFLFIEIKNTNPVSEKKLKLLKSLGVKNLIEVDASYIMRQIGKPTMLKYTKLI